MQLHMAGDKAVIGALNALPDKVYRKVIRQSTGKAATLLVKAARRSADKLLKTQPTGKFRAAIKKLTRTYKADGAVLTVVGVDTKQAPHEHLILLGHRMVRGGTVVRISGKRAGKTDKAKDVSRTGKGRIVGFVPPIDVLTPAFDQTKAQAQAKLEKTIRDGVQREAAKLAKK